MCTSSLSPASSKVIRFFDSIIHRAAQLICTVPEYDDLATEVGLGSHHNAVTDPAGAGEAARRAGWHHRAYLWADRRRIRLRAEYLPAGGGAGQGGGAGGLS